MYPSGVVGVRTNLVRLASGLSLRVLETGGIEEPPLVLIHGWGACVYTFRYLLDALGRGRCRVVAFDLRGHGLSDKPVARGDYSTATLVNDVRELLDALHIQRADLLGHSLGGGIALHFALAHRERLRRLVLAAPVSLTSIRLPAIAHALAPRFTNRFARYLTPRWLTNFLVRSTYGDPRRVTDRDIDEYWAPSQFPDYYRAARALLEEFEWDPLDGHRLAPIDVPTLVILGTADRLIRNAEPHAKKIPGAAVVDLDGAGHLGIEECPTEFNTLVERFISAP
jgi:pimeloyl-ACP methyl ester carboxylesterase